MDTITTKVAVCDDEPEHIRNIRHALPDLEFDTYTNPQLLFETIKSGNEYDVIFLDILMPRLDGISLARELREIDEDTIIIFVTGKIEFAQTGYEVKAFRYLLKEQIPLGLEKIWKEIEIELASKKNEYFIYEFERKAYRHSYRYILYFESNLRKITIHTKNYTDIFYGKLDDIQASSPLFIRIHKSFLVNKRHIRGVSTDTVILSNGEALPVSRKYSTSVGAFFK
jgi:DNA-binding LytR/AlgR family response regulator